MTSFRASEQEQYSALETSRSIVQSSGILCLQNFVADCCSVCQALETLLVFVPVTELAHLRTFYFALYTNVLIIKLNVVIICPSLPRAIDVGTRAIISSFSTVPLRVSLIGNGALVTKKTPSLQSGDVGESGELAGSPASSQGSATSPSSVIVRTSSVTISRPPLIVSDHQSPTHCRILTLYSGAVNLRNAVFRACLPSVL